MKGIHDMKRNAIIYTVVLTLLLGGFTACEDMLGVSSTSIQYEDRHTLNSAGDSLYSVIGILSKLQHIADRTVLLGELRGDLVTDNENTEKDLRELINHDVKASNVYMDYSDYYAVINNCNYFLAKVDTNVIVSGQKVMLKEVAVVKGIRAWTYMQLALIYQAVPFITEPILSLQDAEKAEEKCEYKNLEDMCDYFIPELLPYVDIELPNYGTINDFDSQRFFFPIRLLLGDMYLWKGMYMESFKHYADYVSERDLSTVMYGVSAGSFSQTTNDIVGLGWYSSSQENISVIRMASSKLYGTISNLENIFSPTDLNEGKRAVSPSRLWKELAEKQVFAYQTNANDKVRYLSCGDLRAIGTYYFEWDDGSFRPDRVSSSEAWYRVDVDNKYLQNSKYGSSAMLGVEDAIVVYRIGNVFLRMAEAANRLGAPDVALLILKNGLSQIRPTLDGDYSFSYPLNDMNTNNVKGIHSRGSGSSAANELYNVDFSDYDFNVGYDSLLIVGRDTVQVPQKAGSSKLVDSIAVKVNIYYAKEGMSDPDFGHGRYDGLYVSTDPVIVKGEKDRKGVVDTIYYRYVPTAYFVDKVEHMIVDEMALETAFEGHRFYDLMRVAMRREDPAFLAEKVAHRNGEEAGRDEVLFNKLNDPTYNSWYLHKK